MKAKKLNAKMMIGLKLARVDAVRMLLVRGLDAVEQAKASPKKRS